MYRNNTDIPDGALRHQLYGFNDVELNDMRNTFTDATNPFPSPELSPTSPNAPFQFFSSNVIGMPFGTSDAYNQNQVGLGRSTISETDSSSSLSSYSSNQHFNRFLSQQSEMSASQQQQPQQRLQQQLNLTGAFAQPQISVSPTTGNHQQQKDDISKSLQMFAYKMACKSEQEQIQQQTPKANDLMQDFSYNGFTTDDCFQYQYQYPTMHPTEDANKNIGFDVINSNYSYGISEAHSNIWKMKPTQQLTKSNVQASNFQPAKEPRAISIGVAAASMSNSVGVAPIKKVDNSNNYNKRIQKRFNAAKHSVNSVIKHCVFCENNNEPEAVVKSHAVRDSLGRVLCPKLRTYICPICKASGDEAHTVKYCPQKPIVTMDDAIKAQAFRLAKGGFYKQQMKV
ncbi:protein nanos [Teleopsis dalmanni]|uniref:protein nanos n=1 Tax=Teleopsis dalmanni TaxID=139649 RepID=UPI0018CDC377|nr:protein nanos [Teleopsis dalmanni]